MLHSHQYALLVLSYLAWAFFLVILGSYLRREFGWEKISTTLALFLVMGGLVNAGIVALQYAMQSGLALSWLPKLNGYGALSQANHFADYTALATASLIYLYAKGRFSLKVFAVYLTLFLAMLAFSASRSSWLYLTAFTVLAIGLQVNAMRQRTGSTNMRSLLRVSLVLLPAFAVVQLFINFIVPDGLVVLATDRLIESVNATSTSQRWQLWHESWRMFLQSPWLGIGAGQIRWQSFLLLDTPSAVGAVGLFEHAHNLFLNLLTEMGIGAPLLVLAGIFAWLRGFKWRELSLESWWLLGLLSVLGIHSMLEYPLWYTYFLGIAAVLLGAGEEKLTTVSLPKVGITLGRTAMAGLMLIGMVNLASMVMANAKLETWLLRAMRGDIATQEQPQFFEALNWVHANSLLAPYSELMYATALVIDTNKLDSKLWLSQSAMRFVPMRKIAYQHVLLLKLNGDHTGAVKQLNRTLIAYPGKFTKELEAMPFKYWQDYLDVLSEARPIPQKKK
ncbi:MAG: hypothetical protein HOP26_06475 [Methylotenera sp.]|nr:hypothetical protein [Methylotenera sp.]